MAPIPRCDLRLPSDPGRRRSSHTSLTSRPPESAADNDIVTVESKLDDSSDEIGHGPGGGGGGGHGQLHAQRSKTRDSAEILEGAAEFSTGVTRDQVEILDHKQHEAGTGTGLDDGLEGADDAAPHNVLDPCTVLAQCRAEIEAEAAAAAAAAATVNEDEDLTSTADESAAAAAPTAPPATEMAPTPGDTDARFCADRPESPYCNYNVHAAMASTAAKKKAQEACKGTYTSLETYSSLWGSSKAVTARKKKELEMKKKRKFYERVHARNQKRREREKRRAKEKRRMMRCRDQSKIPPGVDNIGINKAFYLRFNYNKRLPFMPSAMNLHLKKFKKPPFKHFHKGSRACHKHVDEFEKLRVTEAQTTAPGRKLGPGESTASAAAAAKPPTKARAKAKAKAKA